nr:4Fe-4S dicluster domain-containing protein [Prolixibacteraceae bacterium]
LVWGNNITRVWNLRKAGLGVLSNMPGDAKPVSVVEDTAIPVKKLPEFLAEFQSKLDALKLKAVYHAHIATGELHLRPVLNLKDKNDVILFRKMAIETAQLVKKYRGSLSGEHGDGRLRGEFIPFMLGEKVYSFLKEIKKTWDSDNIFNPGKITNTPPMHTSLRYEPGTETPQFNSYFDYKTTQGMARAIEKCNGSGDCRKSEIIGGTMCPSFMATRDELHSTRGRANVLRELITRPSEMNWADKRELFESLDLCLSCKACKSECPSGVDIAKLKAEFLQNHYDANPTPTRSKLIANFPSVISFAMKMKPLSEVFMQWRPTSLVIQKLTGFTTHRPLPHLPLQSFRKWERSHLFEHQNSTKKVYLFADEFVKTTDSHIGIKAIMLLEKLGYEVVIPDTMDSGRTYLSKGFVKKAAKFAEQNIQKLKKFISDDAPLVGIEPSAILTFRDEYPELVSEELQADARKLAENALMFDEFFMREVEKGNIAKDAFTQQNLQIKLHGHCHQKALATTRTSIEMLAFPVNYSVEEIPSGCCGMAGSFGYEKEHYELSMKIGELVLFPEVRSAAHKVVIAAPGTSCREQIEHGTGRKALHPVELMFRALR